MGSACKARGSNREAIKDWESGIGVKSDFSDAESALEIEVEVKFKKDWGKVGRWVWGVLRNGFEFADASVSCRPYVTFRSVTPSSNSNTKRTHMYREL